MAFKLIALTALFGLINASPITWTPKYITHITYAAPIHSGWEEPKMMEMAKEEPFDHHPHYSYSYDVHDSHTGDIKKAQESRKGDAVEGSYSLIEADGSRRIVHYTADHHNGFNAIVEKQPAHIKVAKPIEEIKVAKPIVDIKVSKPIEEKKEEESYYDHNPHYSYAYDVHDSHTGDIKKAQESRKGDAVEGSYSLIEADGSRRIVHYTADHHNGFNAIVEKQPAHIKVAKPIEEKKEEESYYDHNPHYSYAYDVHDSHTGDIKKAQESRKGDAVEGSYSLIEADGSRRIVHYTADHHNGFNAIVEKQPAHIKVAKPIEEKKEEESYYDHNPHYSYAYDVHDSHTGDIKKAQESRKGDAVEGSYSLIEADGSRRIVHYTADHHNGFNVVVEKQPAHIKVAKPIEEKKEEESYYDHNPHYSYSYDVHDSHTGDIKKAQESRKGDAVEGSYSLIEADGSRRIVHYTADHHNGFNAIVEKEPAKISKQEIKHEIKHILYPVNFAYKLQPISHYEKSEGASEWKQ